MTVLEKEKEGLRREDERVQRLIKQKDDLYGPAACGPVPMAFLRGLPGIDIMAPTKIQQISLPELTINYNFKEVPRYDRCQTCHQGIDRPAMKRTADGKDMPSGLKSHPFLTSGATYDRSARQIDEGGPVSGCEWSPPDQQLRLHDLPRRPGIGNGLHVRLALARLARAGGGVEEGAWRGRISTSGTSRCLPTGSSSQAA